MRLGASATSDLTGLSYQKLHKIHRTLRPPPASLHQFPHPSPCHPPRLLPILAAGPDPSSLLSSSPTSTLRLRFCRTDDTGRAQRVTVQIAAHRRTTTRTTTCRQAQAEHARPQASPQETTFSRRSATLRSPPSCKDLAGFALKSSPSSCNSKFGHCRSWSITLPLLPPRPHRPRRRVHHESPQLSPLFPPLIMTRSCVLPSLPRPWSLPPRHGQSSQSSPSFDAGP